MPLLLVWLAFAVLVSLYASKKGRPPIKWFCISLFLSPLISFLAILVMGIPTQAAEQKLSSDKAALDNAISEIMNAFEMYSRELLDKSDYNQRRTKFVSLLKSLENLDNVQAIYTSLFPLVDKGILSKAEFSDLKKTYEKKIEERAKAALDIAM